MNQTFDAHGKIIIIGSVISSVTIFTPIAEINFLEEGWKRVIFHLITPFLARKLPH